MRRGIARAKRDLGTHHLLSKGVYKENTRSLIRILVKAGCSQEHVGKVIKAVLKTAGMAVDGDISRPTVARVIREGLIAAEVQLGYEMKQAGSEFNITLL